LYIHIYRRIALNSYIMYHAKKLSVNVINTYRFFVNI
jgi:hypothetical protein